MKIVVQRVSRAAVRVDAAVVSSIGRGLLLLVAVEPDDAEAEVGWCADKIVGMRVFGDANGKMNRSVSEVEGAILAVSQFTLVGSLRRGRRPSFEGAAPPALAKQLYEDLMERIRGLGVPVSGGVFGAMMEVELINDGPVTLWLDSAERRRPRSS